MKNIYKVMLHSGQALHVEASVSYTRKHAIFETDDAMVGIFPLKHIVGAWKLGAEGAVAVRAEWARELNLDD